MRAAFGKWNGRSPAGFMVRGGFIGLAFLCGPGLAQEAAPNLAVDGGVLHGAVEQGEGVFRAIPYAAPPVGDLRWREPQPSLSWTGTRDATRFGPSCIQDPGFGPTSEDCLTLNVWAPEWPPKAQKAVMVWFHGGGDTAGGSNSEFFYGDSLAHHDVVIVSVNYRLGGLGFMAHSELTRESTHHASGNYGLLDQIAALHWVRENIAKFGGDPARVTIFGQSAGAADIERLLVSPLSKGLFARAIAESGAARRYDPPLAQMEKECWQVIAPLNPPAEGQLSYLRALPAVQILAAFQKANGLCDPINIDGYVLPEQPLKVFAEGREQAVPFMLGNTLREGFERADLPVEELKQEIRAQYGDLAPKAYALYGLTDTRAPAADPLYGPPAIQWGTDQTHRCRVELQGLEHSARAPFYQFQFERALPGQTQVSSTHSDDVPYVFGIVSAPRYAHSFTESDRMIAGQMQAYWTNFAKTGDPNGPGLPAWPRFETAHHAYMAFGAHGAEPSEDLREAQCALFFQAETARPTWRNPERGARW